MAILDRISTLIRANINDLLDRAEDPEKVVKQLLIDMNNGLLQVKTQVAAAFADEHRLKRRWEENDGRAVEWKRKAEIAVGRDDDDLARQALARYNTYNELAAGFQQQYEQQAAQVALLKDALRQLEAKIETVQARKELLIARNRRVKAEMAVRQTMGGMKDVSALGEFQRMEERVEEEELRAAGLKELDEDTVDARFQELDNEERLEGQLQELKAGIHKVP